MNQRPTIIKEGYGNRTLHVGQRASELLRRFGRPRYRKQATTASRSYWLYPQIGLECIVSRRSERVLSLFFLAQGCDGHKGANVRTQAGVRLGDSARRVRSYYGKPSKEGGGFELSSGDYVRAWYSYRQGVGFHFGRRGKLEIIAIFSPSRRTAGSARSPRK